MINELKIDLACGDRKREGFVGVDYVKTPSTDYVMDLTKYPWDIESDSVEELHCSHYVEHIPHNIYNLNDHRDGLIQFMDECYRILKVGGKFTIICPYFTSERAFGDPTHTRYIGKWSFYYFNKQWIETNKLEHYGIKSNFDMTFSYYVSNDLTLKSEEVRNQAFEHDWNAIDDLKVELIKI